MERYLLTTTIHNETTNRYENEDDNFIPSFTFLFIMKGFSSIQYISAYAYLNITSACRNVR